MNDAKRVLHFILSGNYIRFIGARIECGKSDPHLEGCIPTRLKFRVNRYITSGSINKNMSALSLLGRDSRRPGAGTMLGRLYLLTTDLLF